MDTGYLKRCSGMVHVVKSGETLYHLSRMYGVSIDELLRVNPTINMYYMQVGDEVCIPMSNASVRAEKEEERTDSPANRNTGNRLRIESEDFYELVKRFDK